MAKQVMDPRKRKYVCHHPKTQILSDGLAMKVEWCRACGAARRFYHSTGQFKPWAIPTRMARRA